MSKYLKNLLALVPKFGGKMQPFIDSLEHDISCNIFANRCILFVFTFYTTTRLNQNWGLNFLNSKFFPLKLFHNPHRVLCRNWRTCHFRIRHAKMWENINIMMTMIIFLFDIKCTLPTETLQRFTVTVWDNQTEQRPDVPGSGMPAARPITGYTWKVGFTHKYSTPQMYQINDTWAHQPKIETVSNLNEIASSTVMGENIGTPLSDHFSREIVSIPNDLLFTC